MNGDLPIGVGLEDEGTGKGIAVERFDGTQQPKVFECYRGPDQRSRSIGFVMRVSTSRAEAPGNETITSIIGTMIWGSSSLGSIRTAATPIAMEAISIRGVSFE